MRTPAPGTRYLAAAGAALACIAAGLAAVGWHALSGRLSPGELASFNAAVVFQMFNAVGLLAAAWTRHQLPGSALARWSGWSLLAGTLLFCGSIYAVRLGFLASTGPTAPLGGSLVILAWAGLAAAWLRRR